MDFIDNVVGRETFDKLVGVFVRGNESLPESKLAASFACLESLKKMMSACSCIDGFRVIKEILKKCIDRMVQQLPPLPPNVGFSSNQDVMGRHDQWIESFKKFPFWHGWIKLRVDSKIAIWLSFEQLLLGRVE